MQSFIYEYCYQYPPAIFVKPFWWNSLVKRFVNLASGGVYICPLRYRKGGGLLPRLFNLTTFVAVLSVALSLKSPSPGFLRHPVSITLGLSSLTGSPCPRDRITDLKSKVIIYQNFRFVKKNKKRQF